MRMLDGAGTATAVRALNLASDLRAGIQTRLHPYGDRGSYTTETVIVMVALAALALTVMGTLGPKVIAKMHSIDLGG